MRPRALRLSALGSLAAVVTLACTGTAAPLVSSTAPSPTPSPPAQSSSTFTVSMPIVAGDTATLAFGLNPFGIHFGGVGVGGHGVDGHPGWDVEYRIGAPVRAAAAGVVQSVFADVFMPDRFTVQIHHETASGPYRTVYTNVTTLDPAIRSAAPVAAGQPLGVAGAQTIVVGAVRQTYAMTHFQVDDFRRHEGLTNPNAASPEQYLGPEGRALFDAIWRTAAYNAELTEPFPANPRDVAFPFTRSWTLESGSLPAGFEATRLEAVSNAHDYSLRDASGMLLERGSLGLTAASPHSMIDLQPSNGGAPRLGLFDVVGDTLRIDLGAPGAPRPPDLARASIYRTR